MSAKWLFNFDETGNTTQLESFVEHISATNIEVSNRVHRYCIQLDNLVPDRQLDCNSYCVNCSALFNYTPKG